MTIYAGESLDRYGDSDEDRKSLQAERIDWRRIPPCDLHDRHCALAYLDAAGFRFYTPAIMSTIVRGEDERGMLTDSFLWALHDFRKNCQIRDTPYRFIYNRSQRAAIIRSVKFEIYNVPYGRFDDALKKTLDGLRRCANPGNTG